MPCCAAWGSLGCLSCSRGRGGLIIAPQVDGLLQGDSVEKLVPASVAESAIQQRRQRQAASVSLCRFFVGLNLHLDTFHMAQDVSGSMI